MPAEPDHYCWKKLNDAQINHYLDFLHGGVMQNVAMAPALLNFPVVEKPAFLILPEPYTKLKLWIYISVLVTSMGIHKEQVVHQKEHSGTFWIIVPHHREKAWLDLTIWHLKVWMHMILEPIIQKCLWKHWQIINNIWRQFTIFIVHQQNVMVLLIIAWSMDCQLWTAHILMTINQEMGKHKIFEKLGHETTIIVINFTMNFWARKYCGFMANWFGKAWMGMYVSCIILRKPTNDNWVRDREGQSFNKQTYITIVGKANQDAGAVMAIYQSVLEQVKKDFPQICFIIDI